MRKKTLISLLGTITPFFLALIAPHSASAFAAACPVCVVAIGSGLGISRALGVDDALVGIWIGAFLVACASWTASWLKKKWPQLPYPDLISYASFYLLTIPFFALFGLFGQGGLMVWLESNLLIGMIVGTIVLLIGLWLDGFLRQHQKQHKAFFPFQKVIVPLSLLLISTFIMWLITV